MPDFLKPDTYGDITPGGTSMAKPDKDTIPAGGHYIHPNKLISDGKGGLWLQMEANIGGHRRLFRAELTEIDPSEMPVSKAPPRAKAGTVIR